MNPTAFTDVRTQLVLLSGAELGELASFIAAQSGRARKTVERHLRWFLLENPARRQEDPLAYGLRAADQLVGCILLSPQVFCFAGNEFLLMGSSSFYVDEHHRGQGGRIFLQYCRLARQHSLFGTSANAEAAALWKAAGAHPLPQTDHEYFGILNWPPITEELAHRKSSNSAVSRLAGSSMGSVLGWLRPSRIDFDDEAELILLGSAEQVSDLELPNQPTKLTALRDASYLRWRYFSGHDTTAAVFAFRSRQPDRDVMVTVNCRTRGYRAQIRTLNVLDVYPEISTPEGLRMVSALIARYKNVVDAIVLRNLNPELQEVFSGRNFQKRTFDAPIGWVLDKFSLLPKTDWYLVPADGDGLI
jgi:GNAT superfamily N-acetyltransferase